MTPTTRRTPTLLIALLALFALGGCASSIDELDRWDEVRLYQEAKSALTRGEFQTAIRRLETLNARYPFDDYAIQGQLDLMYAYYRAMRSEDVISTAQRFARLNPTHPRVDYALYMQGLADFDRNISFLQRWFPRDPSDYELPVLERSLNAFSELVRRFPESEYAADAQQRSLYLRNQMAEACIDRAHWYIRREAWLSASQRAQQCIQRFNGAPSVEAAPAIMAEGYRQLGMDDLAATAEGHALAPVPSGKPE
ncbi:MAG: outer membrane protein assembly factor BamD [Pseudomonadota bacterium]